MDNIKKIKSSKKKNFSIINSFLFEIEKSIIYEDLIKKTTQDVQKKKINGSKARCIVIENKKSGQLF